MPRVRLNRFPANEKAACTFKMEVQAAFEMFYVRMAGNANSQHRQRRLIGIEHGQHFLPLVQIQIFAAVQRDGGRQ